MLFWMVDNIVVPLENLEKETIKWCRDILRNSPTTIRVLKAAINAVDDGHAELQVYHYSCTIAVFQRTTNFMGQNGCVASYNIIALEFNGKLKNITSKLNQELPDMKLVFSNPYYIMLHIIRKPWFGFESASVACCATGMFEIGYACSRGSMFSCSDASKFFFWDSFHPIEKTNNIVAKFYSVLLDHVGKNNDSSGYSEEVSDRKAEQSHSEESGSMSKTPLDDNLDSLRCEEESGIFKRHFGG
ncbi:GDSL-like lipase/acylhydrolase [Medicago truncatula]|uniref:GDSL-like lipase/acylhydrolase n=1 Tax=Medicago truncatula TaxID=3880 RepID=G7LEP2_MEDTR|nr:GDSL-like lipase/acylhydrolase [Medicago truncatula]